MNKNIVLSRNMLYNEISSNVPDIANDNNRYCY